MFRCRWGGTIRAVPERGVGKATCCQTPPDHLDLRVGRARLSPASGERHCSLLADSRPQGLPEAWAVPTSTAFGPGLETSLEQLDPLPGLCPSFHAHTEHFLEIPCPL